MTTSERDPRIRLLSFLLAAVPFAFGLIRAAQTGHDFRYLWTAAASLVGATVATAAVPARARAPVARMARAAAAVAMSSIGAAMTAWLLGARSVPAVAVVSLAFGSCSSASRLLAGYRRNRAG
jgi:hypothetical protein